MGFDKCSNGSIIKTQKETSGKIAHPKLIHCKPWKI